MLEMRPNCECCNSDLPPSSEEAMICSFECTFCNACVATHLNQLCPNCGGKFSQRPTRRDALLAKFPASTERIHNPDLLTQ